MKNNVTDRLLLKTIYEHYYEEFCSYKKENPNRTTKNYISLDLDVIGLNLNLNSAIVFGRLYYHLDKKYSYRQEDGARVSLFELRMKEEIHLINFPLLSAVLAELEEEYIRFTRPFYISAGALLVSILAVLIAA